MSLLEAIGLIAKEMQREERVDGPNPRYEEELVRRMAEAEALADRAKRLRDQVRAEAIAYYEQFGVSEIRADVGEIKVSVRKGSRRIDTKRVRELLTPEQLEECTIETKPTTVVKFVPNKSRLIFE